MHKLEYYQMPSSAVRILKEKTVLLIIPSSNFSEPEFDYVYAYLRKARLGVKIASVSGTAIGSRGLEVKSTVKLSDARAEDFDAVVVLGDASGPHSHEVSENPYVLKVLKAADSRKRVIGAVGVAVRAIVSACGLNGRMMTAWRDPVLVSLIKEKGGSYVWEPVVMDGNLITADGPSSIALFTDMLIDALTRRRI